MHLIHAPKHDENELHKDFTTSERVAIGKALEEELGKRQGQRTDLIQPDDLYDPDDVFGDEPSFDGDYEFAEKPPVNLPEVKSKETRQIAAEKAGFGSEKTYRDAKKVADQGTDELKEAVDKGEISISAGAELAEALSG